MIWYELLPGSRNVTILEKKPLSLDGVNDKNQSLGLRSFFTMTPSTYIADSRPPLPLHLNHESRLSALKHYQLRFSSFFAHPVYFKYSIDALKFENIADFDYCFNWSRAGLPIDISGELRHIVIHLEISQQQFLALSCLVGFARSLCTITFIHPPRINPPDGSFVITTNHKQECLTFWNTSCVARNLQVTVVPEIIIKFEDEEASFEIERVDELNSGYSL